MQKDKLVLEDYETFSVRGKNRIVIFPNVPFWIAVTETGFKALEEMRKNGDKVKVAQKLYGKLTNSFYHWKKVMFYIRH